MKKCELPASKLVEDFEIYPRHRVDSTNVASLENAIRSGQNVPPIIVDKKTSIIVDGFHRKRAFVRVGGPDVTVPVDVRDYANREVMMIDAVMLNSGHGRRLDKIDRVRCVSMLQTAGVSRVEIAEILRVPEPEVQKLTIRLATTKNAGLSIPGTQHIVLKKGAAWLSGKVLSAEQSQAVRSAPGTGYTLIARQLRDAIECKLIDPDDIKLKEELARLRDCLNRQSS